MKFLSKPLSVKRLRLAEEQQTVHQAGKHTNGKTKSHQGNNALQKPCDSKPKQDHQSAQQVIQDNGARIPTCEYKKSLDILISPLESL